MVEVVAALVVKDGRFMICRRPENKARGLLWEFVGGKVEPGETKEEALARECREELCVKVTVEREFMRVEHNYPDITIGLTVYLCRMEGEPVLLEHNAIAYITPAEIGQYEFCPADVAILEKIREIFPLNKK